MVVKFELKFKFNFLLIYSNFCLNLNSSSSLNLNFFEFYPNSNPEWGLQFFPIGFIPNIVRIQNQNQI
jgi:hypothetical protein